MSREADLVDLIQTANEIYLMNPSGNARSAYIQIDDLCELILKSWLHINVSGWSPVSHQRNGRDYFKGFKTITDEIRQEVQNQPLHQTVDPLLNGFEARRTNRNHFFHDHQMTGLTVTDENCLKAFCDLYDLTARLFPTAFTTYDKPVLRAQMAAIRALKRCTQSAADRQIYNNIVNEWRNNESSKSLKTKGELRLRYSNLAYEYCLIHYYPTQFYDALQQAGLI
jgi:hypothetical protein